MELHQYGSTRSYRLPRSTPYEQQASPSAILKFIQQVEEKGLELHSLMIVRNGCVIAEGAWDPYQLEQPHLLFSLSKSFTSTAIGMAAAEGLLSVEDRVISFFPDEVTPAIEANMGSMRVKHLLSMSTGHSSDTTSIMVQSDNWAKAFLEFPIDNEPGSLFLYNTGATYMLSAIISKVAGQPLLDYLQPRLFEPLGMSGITSTSCPRGIHIGGFGMSVKTEDIAKFGLLYLQNGRWDGQQILQEDWVKEATTSHISNGTDANSEWSQGYGYQFWRCRHGAYRGDGAFGQYCIVMPEQNAVIAITSGLNDMQAVMNAVWEHILPGMQGGAEPGGQEALEQKLTSLAYPPLAQPADIRVDVSLWNGRKYKVDENEAGITEIAFHFSEDACMFHYQDQEGLRTIRIGNGEWLDNQITIAGEAYKAIISGAWQQKDTFVAIIRDISTPFCVTCTVHFEDNSVIISAKRNVSFSPESSDGQLVGHLI